MRLRHRDLRRFDVLPLKLLRAKFMFTRCKGRRRKTKQRCFARITLTDTRTGFQIRSPRPGRTRVNYSNRNDHRPSARQLASLMALVKNFFGFRFYKLIINA